jgi:hypothetical protein
VPFAHARWPSENVAGAQAHLLTGEGHLSLIMLMDSIPDRSFSAAGTRGLGPRTRVASPVEWSGSAPPACGQLLEPDGGGEPGGETHRDRSSRWKLDAVMLA